jgi:hypothetical protein
VSKILPYKFPHCHQNPGHLLLLSCTIYPGIMECLPGVLGVSRFMVKAKECSCLQGT